MRPVAGRGRKIEGRIWLRLNDLGGGRYLAIPPPIVIPMRLIARALVSKEPGAVQPVAQMQRRLASVVAFDR
jgi:hypothetical protein